MASEVAYKWILINSESLLNGHIFHSRNDAVRWMSQRWDPLASGFRVVRRRMTRVKCSCGNSEWVVV